MQEIFLKRDSSYSALDQKKIKCFGNAFGYKFYIANLHLEELWSITHMDNHSPTQKEVLFNIYDLHKFSDNNLLLPSFAIEGFIIQGTAFLDFYMLYLCSIFKINEISYISGRKFITALSQVTDTAYKDRASEVKQYFEKKIFGENEKGTAFTNNWGTLLKDLRNSTVHRDMVYPDFAQGRSLLDKIIGSWPEKDANITCSRFCQDAQNVMFYLITELLASVYGLKWKPGAYKPGMW